MAVLAFGTDAALAGAVLSALLSSGPAEGLELSGLKVSQRLTAQQAAALALPPCADRRLADRRRAALTTGPCILAACWGAGAQRRALEAAAAGAGAAGAAAGLLGGGACGVGASPELISALFNEGELRIRAEEAAGVPVLEARTSADIRGFPLTLFACPLRVRLPSARLRTPSNYPPRPPRPNPLARRNRKPTQFL